MVPKWANPNCVEGQAYVGQTLRSHFTVVGQYRMVRPQRSRASVFAREPCSSPSSCSEICPA